MQNSTASFVSVNFELRVNKNTLRNEAENYPCGSRTLTTIKITIGENEWRYKK